MENKKNNLWISSIVFLGSLCVASFVFLPSVFASDTCSYDTQCSDSYSGCRYCASGGGSLAAPGYFVGGSSSAKCDNSTGCSVDVKCWNSSGPWKAPISSTMPTKVDCCVDSNCNDDDPCTYDTCSSSHTCSNTQRADGASCGGDNVCYNGTCTDPDASSVVCGFLGYRWFSDNSYFNNSAMATEPVVAHCCGDDSDEHVRKTATSIVSSGTICNPPSRDECTFTKSCADCGQFDSATTTYNQFQAYECSDWLCVQDSDPNNYASWKKKPCSAGETCVNHVCVLNPAPTLSFSDSPDPITLGNSTTLTYTVSGATTCTASTTSSGAGSWTGPKAFSDGTYHYNVTPTTTGDKTYTLACSNLGGTTTRNTVTTVKDYYDLTISDISWTPSDPSIGSHVTFSATIKNIGTDPSPANAPIGVKFTTDPAAPATWGFNNNTPSIPANGTYSIVASNGDSGSTWSVVEGTTKVTANVDDILRLCPLSQGGNCMGFPPELSRDNNTASETLCIPNNCASSTCSTETCYNGCKNVSGTKDCSAPCLDCSSENKSNVCSDKNFESCTGPCPGTKDCSSYWKEVSP